MLNTQVSFRSPLFFMAIFSVTTMAPMGCGQEKPSAEENASGSIKASLTRDTERTTTTSLSPDTPPEGSSHSEKEKAKEKEEIKNFITRRLTKDFSFMYKGSQRFNNWKRKAYFSGDTLIYEEYRNAEPFTRDDGMHFPAEDYFVHKEIPLGDINPTRTVVEEIGAGLYKFYFHTTDSEKSIISKSRPDLADDASKSDSTTLIMVDKRTTEQMKKAFDRLITLCGGKKELFQD